MAEPFGRHLRVEMLLPHDDEAVEALARLRWVEWGDEDDLTTWITTTRHEASTTGLPVTFVARLADEIVGGVGMTAHDPEGLTDRSPWIVGTVVPRELRSSSIGHALMARVEAWAAANAVPAAWVSTGKAAAFYRQCGWREVREILRPDGSTASVMTKAF